MRSFFTITFLFVAAYLNGLVYAQSDSVSVSVVTGEFTVEATRISRASLSQPVYITQLEKSRIELSKGLDLGELLSRYASVYVRNNGPGAASVVSYRGLGGSQLRVLWEGMPVNSLWLGVADMSLIPSQMLSEVQLTSGTGSATYGSGISGTLYMKTDAPDQQVSIGQSVGSFGNRISSAMAGMSKGGLNAGFKVYSQNNENNFRYYDPSTGEIENRKRGAYENNQVSGIVNWSGNNQKVKSVLWWSQMDHEIPENIYAGNGSATQYDESLRWLSSWKYFRSRFHWEAQIYLAEGKLNYLNKPLNIDSKTTGQEWVSRFSGTWFADEKLEVKGMFSADLSEVESSNFNQDHKRNRLNLGLQSVYEPSENWNIYPALRLDYYSDFGLQLSPSLGINVKPFGNEIALRALAAHNFRAPTFNDLYWPDGGNPNLQPERGLKTEMGLSYEKKEKGYAHLQQITLFHIDMKDGIKWLPNSAGRFRAMNIEHIVSGGAEWTGRISRSIGDFNLETGHTLSYTRTFIAESRFRNDQAVNRQLPYVPKFKYSGWAAAGFKGLKMQLGGFFIDERFATEQSSSSAIVESYHVLDLSFQYSRKIGEMDISLTAKLNNLTNEQYEVVRYYPMPLRNYLINLTLTKNFE